jgi:hypothetical protein
MLSNARESSMAMNSISSFGEQTVICVGDLHGWIDRCIELWARLREQLGSARFEAATVIFLGDYVDKGPDSKAVLDWLIEQRDSRPHGKTHFIAGNHDFAMAAFLGCLPADCPPQFDLESTNSWGNSGGYWRYPVAGGMHYQGRRWGGDSRYCAHTTFKSYGVRFDASFESRERLIAAVPQAHKDFLRSLCWVCELDLPFRPGKLIAVHAGLDVRIPAEAQLEALRARRIDSLELQPKEFGRLSPLSERHAVRGMHPELRGHALLVSGHHGFRKLEGDRLIIDQSGGKPGRSLEAIILPDQQVISTDPAYFPEQVNRHGGETSCSSKGKGKARKSREDVKPEVEKTSCPNSMGTGKAHTITYEQEPIIAVLRSGRLDVEKGKTDKAQENTMMGFTQNSTICEAASPQQTTLEISGGKEQRPKRRRGRKT